MAADNNQTFFGYNIDDIYRTDKRLRPDSWKYDEYEPNDCRDFDGTLFDSTKKYEPLTDEEKAIILEEWIHDPWVLFMEDERKKDLIQPQNGDVAILDVDNGVPIYMEKTKCELCFKNANYPVVYFNCCTKSKDNIHKPKLCSEDCGLHLSKHSLIQKPECKRKCPLCKQMLLTTPCDYFNKFYCDTISSDDSNDTSTDDTSTDDTSTEYSDDGLPEETTNSRGCRVYRCGGRKNNGIRCRKYQKSDYCYWHK